LGQPIDDTTGDGLSVQTSVVRASRLRVDGSRGTGVVVRRAGSDFTSADLVVRDTVGTQAVGTGAGISVVLGATAVFERTLLARNRAVAFLCGSSASMTTVALSDFTVVDTKPGGEPTGGVGLMIVPGATVELQRARLERNLMAGLSVQGTLHASDVTIRETTAAKTNDSAAGLIVMSGARAIIERLALEANTSNGALVFDPGTHLELSDMAVRGTQPNPWDGFDGAGLIVASGAELVGQRVALEDNHVVGLMAGEANTRVELTDVAVIGTALPPCFLKPGCDGLRPTGVLSVDDAGVRLSRFVVARNGGSGIELAGGGVVDLADGDISGHRVGANVMTPDFDLARIDQRVRYRDNERKLTAEVVPLPKLPTPARPTAP
ncbi:MAG: hypothetical protein JNG84_03010, partial [Archangium sp.]|nr:hypothetical protein [Archangium sp.]